MQKALIRMRDLVSGLLEYERLTAEGRLELKPVDLNALAAEAAGPFVAPAAGRSQQLQLLLSPDPVKAAGDRVLLLQAMTNLISNAVQYTPPGGQIVIRTGTRDSEVFFSVQDSGPGIDRGEQAKLFQPFTRLKSAGGAEGVGLGLSLVKKVVERHGGRVSVQSSPGQGSVFGLHLPSGKLPGPAE